MLTIVLTLLSVFLLKGMLVRSFKYQAKKVISCNLLSPSSLSSSLSSSSSAAAAATTTTTAIEVPAYLKDIYNGNILTLGDGDFGFSSSLCYLIKEGYLNDDNRVLATTLDSSIGVTRSFLNASMNIESIKSSLYGDVSYNIDATNIIIDGGMKFDTIIWNFPHINGKQNIKRNRLLVQNFLTNAHKLLTSSTDSSSSSSRDKRPSILISLCQGQSGCNASDDNLWKQSWKLSSLAGESGLLITNIYPFPADMFDSIGYSPMGHRGYGSSFPIGNATIYQLQLPSTMDNQDEVRRSIRSPLYVHEIHLLYNSGNSDKVSNSNSDNIAAEIDIKQLEIDVDNAVKLTLQARNVMYAYWSVNLVDIYKCPRTDKISYTFQIGYCSTTQAISRAFADSLREVMEEQVPLLMDMSIRQDKLGGKVSQSYAWNVATKLKECSFGSKSSSTSIDDAESSSTNSILYENAFRSVENNNLVRFANDNHVNDAYKSIATKIWKKRVGILSKYI